MNSILLFYKYTGESTIGFIRVYTEAQREQAEKDRDMLQKYGSCDRDYYIENVPNF